MAIATGDLLVSGGIVADPVTAQARRLDLLLTTEGSRRFAHLGLSRLLVLPFTTPPIASLYRASSTLTPTDTPISLKALRIGGPSRLRSPMVRGSPACAIRTRCTFRR